MSAISVIRIIRCLCNVVEQYDSFANLLKVKDVQLAWCWASHIMVDLFLVNSNPILKRLALLCGQSILIFFSSVTCIPLTQEIFLQTYNLSRNVNSNNIVIHKLITNRKYKDMIMEFEQHSYYRHIYFCLVIGYYLHCYCI